MILVSACDKIQKSLQYVFLERSTVSKIRRISSQLRRGDSRIVRIDCYFEA